MSKSSVAFRIKSCKFVDSVYDLGRLPSDGKPQIAFAGRSNVGKSSLLNQLVKQKGMAKVSSTPGKTQALNFFSINESLYFVDLPGYGFAKVPKAVKNSWGKLIEGYLQNCGDLIGLILLIDSRREPTEEDWQLISWLAERQVPVMTVLTKTDKLNRDQANRKVRLVEKELGSTALPFSVVSGVGKNELLSAIGHLLYENSNRDRK